MRIYFIYICIHLEEFEDIKGVIRIRKSKDRQHNGKKKDKKTNNDLQLQNITQKTKDRATRTPLKTGGELRCYRRVSSSCSTCDTRRATAKRHEHHLTWTSCWTPEYVNKYKLQK